MQAVELVMQLQGHDPQPASHQHTLAVVFVGTSGQAMNTQVSVVVGYCSVLAPPVSLKG